MKFKVCNRYGYTLIGNRFINSEVYNCLDKNKCIELIRNLDISCNITEFPLYIYRKGVCGALAKVIVNENGILEINNLKAYLYKESIEYKNRRSVMKKDSRSCDLESFFYKIYLNDRDNQFIDLLPSVNFNNCFDSYKSAFEFINDNKDVIKRELKFNSNKYKHLTLNHLIVKKCEYV